MTDPRWTIDEDGLLRWDDKFFGNYDVCGHQPGSYDALVAAVRDADLLPDRLRSYLTDPDTLADDIDSQIHQHCGSDNSCSDEHNDWVHDLTGQIMKLLGLPALSPPAPDTGDQP